MTTPRLKPVVAMTLAFTTIFSISFAPALAVANADFSGRVVQTDGSSPHVGVVIILLDAEQQEYRSEPTAAEGTFNIGTAPAGTYTVIAETPAGAFLATEQLALVEGPNRPLRLTLDLRTQEQLAENGLAAAGGGMPQTLKWIFIGVIGLGAFYVVNEATEDVDEPPASKHIP